jgi:hypothetical protein
MGSGYGEWLFLAKMVKGTPLPRRHYGRSLSWAYWWEGDSETKPLR